ncbi:MAG: ECF transporter S component [Lachnospiraceae bacterium]|nr:ECF transporter S component [Lachnospiraceae bacterium]
MNISKKTNVIVGMGLLTAIVIVLQALALSVKFGMFTITLVLVPIIVGAALYGWQAGAWLGFVFGVVVLFTDAGLFLAVNIPGTIITCIAKGVAAGIVAGLIYKALSKKNSFLGVLIAGVAAPVVNTGIFLLGCLLFFMDLINEWAAATGAPSAGYYLIFGMVGMNFVVELIINLALAATIVQIIGIARKSNVAD